MAMRTALELLNWLAAHQLLQPEQINQVRPIIGSYPDSRALAKALLSRDWLTAYQVNQILTDKGETLVLGDYRLLERIGEGAMGQVFKAWNLRLHRVTAVKTIHKENLASPKAVERFKREMQTASQLDHPNIVLVRDADQVDNRPYLVMDYMEGTDIARMVKTGGPLPIPLAVDYTRQAALGLQHAFERNVIHRDIKPGNLLVTRTGQKPLVKILDFGLARFESADDQNRLTQVGNILGTVDYIAPEQAENARTADVRSDIYSLGCSLFFMLAGRPPFTGRTIIEKISARLVGAPPRIRDMRPDVPPALDALLQRAMARDPLHRFQTPLEMAQALHSFTQDATPPVVLMAQPVATATAPAGPAPPLALPASPSTLDAASEAAKPAGGRSTDHDMFAFSASAATIDTEAPAAEPPLAAPVAGPDVKLPAPRLNWWLWGGAAGFGLVILILLIVLISKLGGPNRGGPKKILYPADAELQIIPPAPMVFDGGGVKSVLVNIQRKKFQGPVSVEFKDLPEYFSSKPVTILEKEQKAMLRLTVSWPPNSLKADLRIVAVAENLHDETSVNVTVNRANK